ncbi:hypothetical protein M408DRAFT_333339 [Serendipita vermifera MAFF 305830]|uniref:Uncharacterized protein n=1 Tax=Serendipita vermifera MAFF 305830 TaxID=933852 RepID=A0A0C3ANP5_SERVB|nr:hypothetical protein M408DRAFT_333339 [Serendipita vermifera MAFF 305830]
MFGAVSRHSSPRKVTTVVHTSIFKPSLYQGSRFLSFSPSLHTRKKGQNIRSFEPKPDPEDPLEASEQTLDHELATKATGQLSDQGHNAWLNFGDILTPDVSAWERESLQMGVFVKKRDDLVKNMATLPAPERRKQLNRLIVSAETFDAWTDLEGVLKKWSRHNWAIDAAEHRALLGAAAGDSAKLLAFIDSFITVQAIDAGQIFIYIRILKNKLTRIYAPTQARRLVHAITNPPQDRAPAFGRRFVALFQLGSILRNPPISTLAQAQDNVRSIAFPNDIVSGSLSLFFYLRATIEPSLSEAEQIVARREALLLMARLQNWRSRKLDGAGDGATSLSQDERGWAHTALCKCLLILDNPNVSEALHSIFLKENEVIHGKTSSVAHNIKNISRHGWPEFIRRMKEWMEDSASALK